MCLVDVRLRSCSVVFITAMPAAAKESCNSNYFYEMKRALENLNSHTIACDVVSGSLIIFRLFWFGRTSD